MTETKALHNPGREETKQLSITLNTAADDQRPVYLVGNFNNWRTQDAAYRMQNKGNGSFEFQFPDIGKLPPVLEYKYTRGGWEAVELDEAGNERDNRFLSAVAGVYSDEAPQWKKSESEYIPGYLPIIRIISERFEIPQLIKTRRIAAILPHDYEETDKRYPVLYLQDGQNLFDEYAPFGNWAVDKSMAKLTEKGKGDLIIIAIDHADEARISEFTPSYRTRLGKGDGKKYVRFLADTLKPFIDKHFRTLPGRLHTGIGGSSMGGLISIYAGLLYPEVYSKLLVFSPSLWVTPNIPQAAMPEEFYKTKVYLYGGEKESASMGPNLQRFINSMEELGAKGKFDFRLSLDPKGFHNEARWGQEFPKAVEWLFFDQGENN